MISSTLPTFSESYSYTQPGSLAGKQLQISQTGSSALNLNGSWTYNNEGKMTSMTYPSVSNHSGTYTTSYDSMARSSTLVDNSSNTRASNVSYGPSNELLTLNSENNGKAIQQNDLISGEQVIYQYDSLNRLTLAQTVSNSAWGQAFVDDGFGICIRRM